MARRAVVMDEEEFCTHEFGFKIHWDSDLTDRSRVLQFLDAPHLEGLYTFVAQSTFTLEDGCYVDAMVKCSHWLTLFEFKIWHETSGIGI